MPGQMYKVCTTVHVTRSPDSISCTAVSSNVLDQTCICGIFKFLGTRILALNQKGESCYSTSLPRHAICTFYSRCQNMQRQIIGISSQTTSLETWNFFAYILGSEISCAVNCFYDHWQNTRWFY